MGMDLCSKRKPKGKDNLYYRFNVYGWAQVMHFLGSLGCDLSEFSNDLVSPKSCIAIADRLDLLQQELINLMTCDVKDLLTKMGSNSIVVRNCDWSPSGREISYTNYITAIIDARLKDIVLDPVTLLNFNDNRSWDDIWTLMAYYLQFGDFCRNCSKLDGFEQL